MTDSPTSTKRRVNELMRDGLRRRAESEQIAFFCECADSGCYQAIWLTGAEYDRARSDPSWAAVLPGHRVERSDNATSPPPDVQPEALGVAEPRQKIGAG